MITAVTSASNTQNSKRGVAAQLNFRNFGEILAETIESKASANGKTDSSSIVSASTVLDSPLDTNLSATSNEGQDSASTAAISTASTLNEAIAAREYTLLKIRGLSDDEIKQFQTIKDEAANATSAKTFLLGLSSADRAMVKKANGYAMSLNDSDIQSMTEEGARNMVVTQDERAYVDYNNDGIVDRGVGKNFIFPPPNAPEEVKDAWEKTVSSFPEKDRLLASNVFMIESVQANIKIDAQGNPIGVYSPGDDGYTNIFPTTLDGWQNLLNKADDYLNWVASVDPGNSQLEVNRDLVAAFRRNLSA
jgi:hypothetical protein